MKSYIELVQEVLNQRSVIDNRNIVDLSETSQSVLIAFNQACEFMRDLHNWKWNNREAAYLNDAGQDLYPMPYGNVSDVIFRDTNDEDCRLSYVSVLSAKKGIPSQWTHKWDSEEIQIAHAAPSETQTIIKYNDRNIAYMGNRDEANLMSRFDLNQDTTMQFLNVPENIYDAYKRCVVLKARVFLNQGAQTTVFPAQGNEWNEAYYGLMSFAKTPFYNSEFTEI